MNQRTITSHMARRYYELFVNRRAYTLQSHAPNPNGRHYYYRPRAQSSLKLSVLNGHLTGRWTIGLYAINPETQKAKWGAIDADYPGSVDHLLALQAEFSRLGISSAFELSRRGGHLWIFAQESVPARLWRILILNTARRIQLPIKGGLAANSAGQFASTRTGRLLEGIEVFPKQDSLDHGEFGNAMRGPLGIHRADGRRYWFSAASENAEKQLDYLDGLLKVSETTIVKLTEGLSLPEEFIPIVRVPAQCAHSYSRGFRILDHVKINYTASRNYWARCPSCADGGRDKSGDNLAILVRDPRFYRCWAGCTREMIREVLGHPIQKAS